MSRRQSYLWLVAGLGAMVLLIFVVRQIRSSEPRLPRREIASGMDRVQPRGDFHVAPPQGHGRVQVPADADDEEFPAELASLAGQVVFEDGIPAAGVVLQAVPEMANAVHDDEFTVTTQDDGSFQFSGVPPGRYTLCTKGDRPLPVSRHEPMRNGTTDAIVALDGYKLSLRILAPHGESLAASRVRASLTARDDRASIRSLYAWSNERGVADLYSRSEGALKVMATSSDGAFAVERNDLYIGYGTSALQVDLVLLPVESTASLRVRVECMRGDAESPFNLRILDKTSRHELMTVNSEDLDASGLVDGVPTGEVIGKLDWRYREPVSFYEKGAPGTYKEMDLEGGVIHDVVFRVECGGRIAISFDSSLQVGEARENRARAELLKRNAEGEYQIEDRRLDVLLLESDGRWTDGLSFPVSRRVISSRIMDPGLYRIIVETDSGTRFVKDLEVHRARLTECVITPSDRATSPDAGDE